MTGKQPHFRFLLAMLRACSKTASFVRITINPRPHPTPMQRNSFSTAPQAQDHIQLELDQKDENVVIMRLNRPDKLNAMTEALGKEFQTKVSELRNRPNLRAVVVTGAGKAFSAGGDLDFLLARTKIDHARNIRSLPCPVIAAVNGAAVGAGACFALATDVRIIADDAKIGFNFVKLGIHPGMGCTHFLPKIVGPQHANDLLLTGRLVTGAEARQIGLVHESLPSSAVLPHALDMARRIAQNSPISVLGLTETLRAQLDQGLPAALQREAEQQAICYAKKDLLEGIAAIKERRDPKFAAL